MLLTKAFNNGDSQAVYIPAELAYSRPDIDLEIERIGDEIRIRPKQRKLDQLITKFAGFSPDFMVGGRSQEEDRERGN